MCTDPGPIRVVLALCLLGMEVLAAGDVATVVRTDCYEVSGTNAATLMSSMKQRRPGTYDASTAWRVDGIYESTINSTECVLRSFRTKLYIRYTFPKWVGLDRADKSLQEEWRRYLAATILHERGHADLGLAAAKEMVRAINSGTWRGASSNELKAQIDQACQDILKEFKAKEAAYDEETDHGRTQGARFGARNAGGSSAPSS